MYFVQTSKAKRGFGSDAIRGVTPTGQNCSQTKWKRLKMKSDISVNMDVFNRRFVTHFPKIALDYDVDFCRYYAKSRLYCNLSCLETYSNGVQNFLDRNLQTVSFSMLGHFTVRVITCFEAIL
jgi:hypothetical protein